MSTDTLELSVEQMLAPVDEAALEALLSQRTLSALRRRHPRGAGLFLLSEDGQVFYDPGHGETPFPLTRLDRDIAQTVPRIKHEVDLVA